MIAAVGDFKFDVYSSRPEVARWIFSSFPTCGKVYDEYFSWHSSNALRHYPLALTISHFVVVHYEGARWRELNKLRPKLVHICETIDRFRVAKDVNEIIAAHPRLDGHLARQAYFMNLDRHNLSQAMSGIDYRGDQLDLQVDPAVTDKFGLGGRRYITIHNGFDAEFHSIYSREPKSTKVYPHFAEAIRLLREQHPDIFIVQLGTKTSVPLPGIDAQLVNKTTLGEMTAVLSGSSLHQIVRALWPNACGIFWLRGQHQHRAARLRRLLVVNEGLDDNLREGFRATSMPA